MQKTIRTKKRSWTLPVTFGLGIGIGLTLCYGLVATLEWNFAPVVQDPGLQDPAPVVEVQAPAPELSTDLEGLWPAKHLFISLPGTSLTDDTRAMLDAYKPGGILLQAENLENLDQATQLIADIKAAVGLGNSAADWPLIALDPLSGAAMESLDLPFTRSPAELGREADTALTRSVALSYALAARDIGIGIIFAPDCSLYTHGLSRTAIASRCFGQDVNAVNAHAQAYFSGLQEGNALAVAMPYPGVGSALYEGDLLPIVQERAVERLARSMLPFSELVKQGVPGMLIAQVAVPGLDENSPHRPAAFSPILVDSVIRREWEYEGVLIADDIAAPWLVAEYGLGGATVAALTAGCDAVLLKNVTQESMEEVCGAILYATKIAILRPTRLSASKLRLENWQSSIQATEPVPPEPETPPAPEEDLPPGITAPELEPVVKTPPPLEGEVPEIAEGEEPPETPPEVEAPPAETDAEPAEEPAEEADPDAPASDAVEETDTEAAPEADTAPESTETDESAEGVVAETPSDETLGEHVPAETLDEEAAPETDKASADETEATEEVVEPNEPVTEKGPVEGGDTASPETEATPEVAATEESATAAPEAAEGPETPATAAYEPVADESTAAPESAEEPEAPAAETPEPAAEGSAAAPETAETPGSAEPVATDSAVTPDPPGTTEEALAPEEKPAKADNPDTDAAEAYTAYTVQAGDTLSKVARKFNTTREELMALNKLDNPDLLKLGFDIKVPKK